MIVASISIAGLLSPSIHVADSKTESAAPVVIEWNGPDQYQMGDAVVVPDLPGVKSVWLGGRPMTHLPKRKVWLGVAPAGNVGLVFHMHKTREMAEKVIQVISPKLEPKSTLRIPAEVWKKVTDGQEVKRARDRAILKEILSDYSGEFTTDCWQAPLKSSITSPFGSPRRLPDGHAYHHSGEDRRAGVGTPVKASGAGRVAFAGSMVLPGINVVLSHGDGWFSRYMHFQKLKVGKGARVKTGQVIGLSGASGRVEAPHLHWEILWKGIPANPARFLQDLARLCDPK